MTIPSRATEVLGDCLPMAFAQLENSARGVRRLRAHFESGFKPAREFGIGLEYERFGVIARPRAGASALGDPLPLDGPVSITLDRGPLAGWQLQAASMSRATATSAVNVPGPVRLTRGSGSIASLPPAAGIEVAFAGRSNVGKSSLINALVGQKALARTSNTPGRTQELNFFGADAGITIVDMPGYGYARAPKTQVADWTKLIFDFLRSVTKR